MSMPVSTQQIPLGETYMYSAGFRNLIENHLVLLRSEPSTNIIQLDPHDELKYTGDFYQLLHTLGVGQDLFWITLRVNNLHSPIDYSGDKGFILLPSYTFIVSLLTKFINTVNLS